MTAQCFHRVESHPLGILCAILLLAVAGSANAQSHASDALHYYQRPGCR